MSDSEFPQEPIGQQVKRRSRLAFLFRPAVGIPVTILILIVAGCLTYRASRFRGIPPIPEIVNVEVDGRFHVDDSENAYTHYRQIAALLPSDHDEIAIGGLELHDLGWTAWESVPPAVVARLRACDAALEKWKVGTQLDQAVLIQPADVTSATVVWKFDGSLRACYRLVEMKIAQSLYEGRTAEAWDWIHALLRFSRHSGQHGGVNEWILGVTSHAIACQWAGFWAAHPNVTEADLRTALAEVQSVHRLSVPMSNVLKAEYIWESRILATTPLRSFLTVRGPAVHAAGPLLWLNGEPELASLVYRHLFQNWMTFCDLPRWERPPQTGRWGLFTAAASGPSLPMPASDLNEAARRSIITRMEASSYALICVAQDRHQCRQLALELCLTSEIYRRQHGHRTYADSDRW